MSNAAFSEESTPASLDKPLTPEAPAEPKSRPARRRRRWPLMLGVIGAVVLIVVGIPRIIHALNTVSTDDAYVNSHVTFVAPRVIGQVATREQSKATLVLAQAEFDRADRLLATKVISAEEWDQRRKDLDVAKAQVQQAG
jgi:multidrug resistance efflux pump